MRKALAVLIFGASLLSGQILVPFPFSSFPAGLKTYLELTDDQVSKIDALNATLTALQSTKAQRQAQVQFEISQETSKETLDPMALGVRYLELEAIRRELSVAQQKTVADIQALLTPAQKTKLSALQDAMKLASTGCEAIGQNLLPPPAPATALVASSLPVVSGIAGSFASFVLRGSTCGSVPTSAYVAPLP